jgi:hypothetical protein
MNLFPPFHFLHSPGDRKKNVALESIRKGPSG